MSDHTWCDVCNGVIDGNDDDQPRVFVCWNCFHVVYSKDDGQTYVCGDCGLTPEEWMRGHGEVVQLGFPFVGCWKLFDREVYLETVFGPVTERVPSPRAYENEEWDAIMEGMDQPKPFFTLQALRDGR